MVALGGSESLDHAHIYGVRVRNIGKGRPILASSTLKAHHQIRLGARLSLSSQPLGPVDWGHAVMQQPAQDQTQLNGSVTQQGENSNCLGTLIQGNIRYELATQMAPLPPLVLSLTQGGCIISTASPRFS